MGSGFKDLPLVLTEFQAECIKEPIWMWCQKEKSMHLPGIECRSSVSQPEKSGYEYVNYELG